MSWSDEATKQQHGTKSTDQDSARKSKHEWNHQLPHGKGQLFSQMLEWFRTVSQLDWVSYDHFLVNRCLFRKQQITFDNHVDNCVHAQVPNKANSTTPEDFKAVQSQADSCTHQNLQPASYHFQMSSQLGRTLFLPVLDLAVHTHCTRGPQTSTSAVNNLYDTKSVNTHM